MTNPDDTTVVIIAYALSLGLLLGYAGSLLLRLVRESNRSQADQNRPTRR